MKKLFDDEEDGIKNIDKAKILVTVLPFVLIILVLAVTLLVNGLKKSDDGDAELQQSIKEYADENLGTSIDSQEDALTADSDAVSNGTKDDGSAAGSASPEAAASAQPTASPYVMETGKVDYSKIAFETEPQLKEMMTYWSANNQKALDDLAKLDRFIAMSYSLRNTTDCYYYGDKAQNGEANGTGIAVYADNQYYYGEWKNGVRSGNGTWIHYHLHQTADAGDMIIYHQYTGSWANDLPEGEGSEHYDIDYTLLKENAGYNTNLIGSYLAGLINGEFYLTNIYSDGNTKEWYATADHGSWVYQNENKDTMGRRPVQVEDRNPDNYIWMYPKDNVKIGVKCLISKAWE